MNIVKKFMEIGGAKTQEEFYKMYPTEEAFLMKHGRAVSKLMAKGGEAYPQTATMDNFFSYGVPVPPTYYEHGGAFPMAQPEQMFFSPGYGNVYNPYNKAMGGTQESFPQAIPYGNLGTSKAFYFMQEGGQDMPNEQEPERMGVLNRTGSFASMLKTTAAKSNARTALNQIGMAKYGQELKKYEGTTEGSQTASSTQPPSATPNYLTKEDLDAWWKSINTQQMPQSPMMYGYSPMPFGYMDSFTPSIYNWNNPNQFMFQEKGSPNYKWKTDVPGQGKRKGVSNMDFLNAIFPELYGDSDAQLAALNDPKYADRRNQWGISQISQKPKGLFGKRRQTDIYFGNAPVSSAGSTESMSPYGPYAGDYKFAPEIETPINNTSTETIITNPEEVLQNKTTTRKRSPFYDPEAMKYGGSYKQGDVLYMTDDEIAEFIKNGGQIEELE